MYYCGIAKNSEEKKTAAKLASTIFQKEENEFKQISLLDNPNLKNVVIIKSSENKIIGTAFLVERFFPRDGRSIKGTFISSICIHEQWRKKGLSTLLINKCCDLAYKNKSLLAIVIARRKVDYYYNQYGFWGIGNYNIIVMKNDFKNTFSDLNEVDVKISDLMTCSNLYKKTYKNLYGHCRRSIKKWQYILQKKSYQKLNFCLYKYGNKNIGYSVIDNEGSIHELSFSSNPDGKKIIYHLMSKNNQKEIVLNLHSNHPILDIKFNFDISLKSRECYFGGHMIKPLDVKKLFLENEKQKINYLNKNNIITRYSKKTQCNEKINSLGDLQKLLRICRFNYKNEELIFDNCMPFNIPLLDQI